MNIIIRQKIKNFHLFLDGWIGKKICRSPSIGEMSTKPHNRLHPNNFKWFSYSKYSHFSQFLVHPKYDNQSPKTCDLKVYQDSLVFTFIKDNIPKGARILEIGGGESRIISVLKDQYEIWNLDKLEGEGYGPTRLFEMEGFKLVKGYIGELLSELPNSYFDLVFSISTLEHVSDDVLSIDAILNDIQRLLRRGGFSLHCVDGLFQSNRIIVHGIVNRIYQLGWVQTPAITFEELSRDDDLWLLSPYAFYTRWYHIVNKSMRKFGYPFSVNTLWQKIT